MTALAYGVGFFFGARIREAARQSGAALVEAPSGSLIREAERAHPDLVLVELERTDLAEVGQLKAHPSLGRTRVIGFGAHVREELLAQARSAGCDAVLTKGQLAARLPAFFQPLP